MPWRRRLLFVLAAAFMTVVMAATSIAPAYDVQGGAISDLGVIGETARLFNGSLVAVGALNVALAAVTSADLRFATAAPASARAVMVANATPIPRLMMVRSLRSCGCLQRR